jgi:DNA-binding IclR family transcriptional regulator
MRHGTVFSLAHTASGRLFAAWQAPKQAREHLEAERRQVRTHPEPAMPGMPPAPALPAWKDFEPQLAEVRARGLSRSVGEVLTGVNAMAAPVFDHTGAMVLAITAIGSAALFDTDWDGAIARALREGAAQVSERLGAAVRG